MDPPTQVTPPLFMICHDSVGRHLSAHPLLHADLIYIYMKNIKSKVKTKQRIFRKAVCVCVLLVMIAPRAGLLMCHMMS